MDPNETLRLARDASAAIAGSTTPNGLRRMAD